MRLLLIANDYPPQPGGIQQYLENLVAAYPDPILVLAPSHPQAVPEREVLRYPAVWMGPTPHLAEWMTAQAKRFAPDVVLFGAPYPLPLVGPSLRRDLGVPFAVLCHGGEITMPGKLPGSRRWLRRLLRSADWRLAVSEYTASQVKRLTGLDTTVIRGGVDIEAFSPRADPGWSDPPVIGCVSRFVPRKGQHRLLEAVAQLGRPCEVTLVGRGRREEELRRLAADLGVNCRFEVDVPWERLPELYRQMDIFCMPCRSRWAGLEAEGLGLVFLEAAASGLPVLAGDSGGAPETLDAGRTGFLVHGTDDIVEALTLLLDDPERAQTMGRAGRARVEAEFTWDKVVERLQAALAGT